MGNEKAQGILVWNEEITALVKEKQCSFKLLKGPKKCKEECRL